MAETNENELAGTAAEQRDVPLDILRPESNPIDDYVERRARKGLGEGSVFDIRS
jgi:hypothetical protein